MRTLLIGIVALLSFSALADIDWHDRLYCYGTFSSSSKFVVELTDANDQLGLQRQVYFQKTVSAPKELVTNQCSLTANNLICKSSKIKIIVNIESLLSHRGIWDAASYGYYPAEVTRKSGFKSKTEAIRCRF